MGAWQLLFLLKPMPMLGMDMVVIFTNKPGLEHVDLASKVPATDAVSQLTTSSANVKPKPNPTTAMVDTDMVAMDTDTDTDTVTTLVRDLLMLNHITDTHTLTTVTDTTHTPPPAPLAKAGVAGHPTGTSYTQRSPQGLRGKRSA